MELSPDRRPPAPSIAEDYERGAERLLAAIALAVEPGASFPEQVETALRTILALFAAEPELGRLLTVQPFAGDEAALDCYQRWQQRSAALLRAAAARSPSAHVHPPFLEPALIDGISWQISRRLLAGGADHLEDLLPSLMEFVLLCYFGPEQAGQLFQVQ
ncbi:MAG TPA: hypothetical protein VNY83_01395 [Solirubrobacterales bacterium]|jgi:hypothetical protein|nr:hypothetical protein [Solirubrobacterales bacterium]